MNNLVIFGGTFDPIHNGHINTACAVQAFFHFDEFRFLPCKLPLLKPEAHANAQHRLAMLKVALSEQPKSCHFRIDSREIDRHSPSYMVTTLEDIRSECGNALPISLMIGIDGFSQLPKWHQWEKLTDLTNFLVIERSGFQYDSMPLQVRQLLKRHEAMQPDKLLTTAHGLIFRFNAGKYDISSTIIRNKLSNLKETGEQLPAAVLDYIKKHQLYID